MVVPPIQLDPNRENPCGTWEPIGQDLTSTASAAAGRATTCVATERAPADRRTLWAATRTGRLFITKERG